MTPIPDPQVAAAVSQHLARIGAIGFNGADRTGKSLGHTRLAFSAEEDRVHEYAAAVLTENGLKVRTDPFGNLYGATDRARKRVMIGTHLDTVLNGGNFDGVVGFVVAVEAVRAARRRGWPHPPVEVAVFRAEESTRFNKSCLGSRAAFGRLAASELQTLHYKDAGGETSLGEALAAKKAAGAPGIDPAAIGRPLIDPGEYSAYFETHIEQARVLDGRDRLGVVTSIRAPERRQFTVSHKSGRPHPVVLRAAARMITAVEWTAELFDGLGDDVVATVGKVADYFKGAVAVNTIPGEVSFPLRGWADEDARVARFVAAARRLDPENSGDPPAVTVTPGPDGVTVVVRGTADHSGGTPMGRLNRRDALAAACEIVQALPDDRLPPVAQVRFYLDLRSRGRATRARVGRRIIDTLELIAGGFAVELEIDDPTERGDPVKSLDPGLQKHLQEAAAELGIATDPLASGAGHDAMIAAQAGIPTAMLFVPSEKGLSHNPEEKTDERFICQAVEVQAKALQRLAAGG